MFNVITGGSFGSPEITSSSREMFAPMSLNGPKPSQFVAACGCDAIVNSAEELHHSIRRDRLEIVFFVSVVARSQMIS